MENLLEETKEILIDNGKSIEDIRWIGSGICYVDINKFLELADTEYDGGYGVQEVADDLVVVGDDWWLERREYDGAECWEMKSLPNKPKKYLDLKCLTLSQAISGANELFVGSCLTGNSLTDLNGVDKNDE